MLIDSKAIINISDLNQNFSKVAKIIDEKKKVVVMKNNKPKYIILEFPDESIRVEPSKAEFETSVSKIIEENAEALGKLAQ